MVKFFAHRGYHNNKIKQNSIEALDFCYSSGFYGVEFDIWFVENELIIAHDKPQDIKDFPKFRDYLKYGDKLVYWADFKNLQDLSEDDLQNSIKAVKRRIEDRKIAIENFYFAPFITNFQKALPVHNAIRKTVAENAQIMAVIDDLSPEDYDFYCQKYLENNIKNISINYKNINQEFMKKFESFNIFAWTINESDDLKNMKELKVNAICTDKITPQ